MKGNCGNCKYWRHKVTTHNSWGICDNWKNEVKVNDPRPFLNWLTTCLTDKDIVDEVELEIRSSIRYPEDFGCRFFEPLKTKKTQTILNYVTLFSKRIFRSILYGRTK